MTIVNVIPWILTGISILFAIYSYIKNSAKDERKESKSLSADMATVFTKLDSIQTSVDKINDNIDSIQEKLDDHAHRITVLETLLKIRKEI